MTLEQLIAPEAEAHMSTLNPRVDFAFKKLFGTKENKEILISFINAVVSEEDRVADVVLLNPYNNKEYQFDKLSILDIKATDEKGRQYNIEMQITDQVYYNQRILYYWSKLYASQLQQGDGFAELKKTISINVLNFDYFDDEPRYHNIFKILNVESHKNYFEDLELHFIELHKFNEEAEPIRTTLDRWTKFLKKAHHYDKESFPEDLKKEPAIEKAFLRLNTLYFDKAERDVYEARLKWLRDEGAALQKAHENGHEEGKAEGLVEGEQKALEKIAMNMLRANKSPEEISQITGLSLDKIHQLRNIS